MKELFNALSKAQSMLTHASKDANNPHFKSGYATLESVIDASREALTNNGLSITQGTKFIDGQWLLITSLCHVSGEVLTSETPIFNERNNAQGFGSGMTYARRYAWSAIIGLTQADDDANDACQKTVPNNQRSFNEPSPPPPVRQSTQPSKPIASQSKLSQAQIKRFFSIAASKNVNSESAKKFIKFKFNKEIEELNREEYDLVCSRIGIDSNDNIPEPPPLDDTPWPDEPPF